MWILLAVGNGGAARAMAPPSHCGVLMGGWGGRSGAAAAAIKHRCGGLRPQKN
jgi:hypothetical protein